MHVGVAEQKNTGNDGCQLIFIWLIVRDRAENLIVSSIINLSLFITLNAIKYFFSNLCMKALNIVDMKSKASINTSQYLLIKTNLIN